jgi:hypothetical protein
LPGVAVERDDQGDVGLSGTGPQASRDRGDMNADAPIARDHQVGQLGA